MRPVKFCAGRRGRAAASAKLYSAAAESPTPPGGNITSSAGGGEAHEPGFRPPRRVDALMKGGDARCDLLAVPRAVEHAVMADALLLVMLFQVRGDVGADVVRGIGLAD